MNIIGALKDRKLLGQFFLNIDARGSARKSRPGMNPKKNDRLRGRTIDDPSLIHRQLIEKKGRLPMNRPLPKEL